VQTIIWGQLTSEAGVLPNPCGWGTLHGSEVYLTGVGTQSGPALEGFFVIIIIKNEFFVIDLVTALLQIL
jgi:hypothetical protein